MIQISNMVVLLIYFLLFPFLVFTKPQVLNLRMGRSRDPLLQKAHCPNYSTYSRPRWLGATACRCLCLPCHWYFEGGRDIFEKSLNLHVSWGITYCLVQLQGFFLFRIKSDTWGDFIIYELHQFLVLRNHNQKYTLHCNWTDFPLQMQFFLFWLCLHSGHIWV